MLTLGYQGTKVHRQGIPILINSAHHGDEKISVKVVLGLIDFIEKSRSHPGVQSLLNDFCFYLVPLVNPDGYAQGTRANAQGIDINRDYFGADQLNETAHQRFETPEARHLNRLMSRLDLAGALALHSGAEAIYWPLGESPYPPRDEDVFKKISSFMAHSMGLKRVMQSYFDYPTQGEFIDYAYKRFGVLGVTLEVSYHHQPAWNDVDPIVYRSIKGILVYAKALAEHRLSRREGIQPQLQVSGLTDLVLPHTPKS
jgi:predicted deacylase